MSITIKPVKSERGWDVVAYDGSAEVYRVGLELEPETGNVMALAWDTRTDNTNPRIEALTRSELDELVRLWMVSEAEYAVQGNMPARGTKVYSRDGKQIGYTTGSATSCRMESCPGLRLGVRWEDGKLTYPCTKDMVVVDSGLQLTPDKETANGQA